MAEDKDEYHHRLEITQQVEDMIDFAKPFLVQFPRTEKNVFAATIEKEMYTLLRLCVTAESGYKFKTTVQEMDISQKTLKRYIRLAYRRKVLPLQHYNSWSSHLVSIGKMVGGLIKAVNQPAQHRG